MRCDRLHFLSPPFPVRLSLHRMLARMIRSMVDRLWEGSAVESAKAGPCISSNAERKVYRTKQIGRPASILLLCNKCDVECQEQEEGSCSLPFFLYLISALHSALQRGSRLQEGIFGPAVLQIIYSMFASAHNQASASVSRHESHLAQWRDHPRAKAQRCPPSQDP